MPTISKSCFCCGSCCTKTPGGTLPQPIPPLSLEVNGPTGSWTPFWSQVYKPSPYWYQNNWNSSTIQIANNTPCDCKTYFRFVVTDACENTEDPQCTRGTVRLTRELNISAPVLSCMGQGKAFTFPNIETGGYLNCCAVKAEMQYRAFMPCGGPSNPPQCSAGALRTQRQHTVQVTGVPPSPPAPPYVNAAWLGEFTIVATPTCSKNQVWLAEFSVEITFPPWTKNPPAGARAIAQCLSVTAIPGDCAFNGLPVEADSMNLCYPNHQYCSCTAPPPPAYGPYKSWDLTPGKFVYGAPYISRTSGGTSIARYKFATLGGEGAEYEQCCCNQYVSTWRYGWST